MSIYEASFKTTNPTTGEIKFSRLFTMRARSAAQVEAHVARLGLLAEAQGELIVYRY